MTETKERKRRSSTDTKLLFEKVSSLPFEEKVLFAKDLKENINQDLQLMKGKADTALREAKEAEASINGL